MAAPSAASATATGAVAIGAKATPVRVYVRIRPPMASDQMNDGRYVNCLEVSEDGKTIKVKEVEDEGGSLHPLAGRPFTFDRVFDCVTQRDIYDSVMRDTLDDVMFGFHGTVFVYGQTGAGKTYTIAEGIIPLTIDDLFARIDQESHPPDPSAPIYSTTVTVSMMQIYCEKLQDLLAPQSGGAPRRLLIRQSQHEGVFVTGLHEPPVRTKEDLMRYYKQGAAAKAMRSTAMNDLSSRSHTVLRLSIRRAVVSANDTSGVGSKRTGDVLLGRLHLIDLAGCENLKKSAVDGEGAIEARAINVSLLNLRKVVTALVEKSERRKAHVHIPFRESTLTWLLCDALGGESVTKIIVNVGPSSRNAGETIGALEFGQFANRLQTRKVARHELDPKAAIKRLQTALAQQEAITEEFKRENATLKTDNSALRQRVRALTDALLRANVPVPEGPPVDLAGGDAAGAARAAKVGRGAGDEDDEDGAHDSHHADADGSAGATGAAGTIARGGAGGAAGAGVQAMSQRIDQLLEKQRQLEGELQRVQNDLARREVEYAEEVEALKAGHEEEEEKLRTEIEAIAAQAADNAVAAGNGADEALEVILREVAALPPLPENVSGQLLDTAQSAWLLLRSLCDLSGRDTLEPWLAEAADTVQHHATLFASGDVLTQLDSDIRGVVVSRSLARRRAAADLDPDAADAEVLRIPPAELHAMAKQCAAAPLHTLDHWLPRPLQAVGGVTTAPTEEDFVPAVLAHHAIERKQKGGGGESAAFASVVVLAASAILQMHSTGMLPYDEVSRPVGAVGAAFDVYNVHDGGAVDAGGADGPSAATLQQQYPAVLRVLSSTSVTTAVRDMWRTGKAALVGAALPAHLVETVIADWQGATEAALHGDDPAGGGGARGELGLLGDTPSAALRARFALLAAVAELIFTRPEHGVAWSPALITLQRQQPYALDSLIYLRRLQRQQTVLTELLTARIGQHGKDPSSSRRGVRRRSLTQQGTWPAGSSGPAADAAHATGSDDSDDRGGGRRARGGSLRSNPSSTARARRAVGDAVEPPRTPNARGDDGSPPPPPADLSSPSPPPPTPPGCGPVVTHLDAAALHDLVGGDVSPSTSRGGSSAGGLGGRGGGREADDDDDDDDRGSAASVTSSAAERDRKSKAEAQDLQARLRQRREALSSSRRPAVFGVDDDADAVGGADLDVGSAPGGAFLMTQFDTITPALRAVPADCAARLPGDGDFRLLPRSVSDELFKRPDVPRVRWEVDVYDRALRTDAGAVYSAGDVLSIEREVTGSTALTVRLVRALGDTAAEALRVYFPSTDARDLFAVVANAILPGRGIWGPAFGSDGVVQIRVRPPAVPLVTAPPVLGRESEAAAVVQSVALSDAVAYHPQWRGPDGGAGTATNGGIPPTATAAEFHVYRSPVVDMVVAMTTWNVHGRALADMPIPTAADLTFPHRDVAIFVFGLQGAEPDRGWTNQATCEWLRHMFDAREYYCLGTHSLFAVKLVIFARLQAVGAIGGVDMAAEQLAQHNENVCGKKGVVAAGLRIYDTLVLFACVHVGLYLQYNPYTPDSVECNNASIIQMLKSLVLFDGTVGTDDFDHVYVLGSLNYHVRCSAAEGDDYARRGLYDDIMYYDQLSTERRAGTILHGFREGKVRFPPSFRIPASRRGREICPSYPDRILWRSNGSAASTLLQYASVASLSSLSSHCPVKALALFQTHLPLSSPFTPAFRLVPQVAAASGAASVPRLPSSQPPVVYGLQFLSCTFVDVQSAAYRDGTLPQQPQSALPATTPYSSQNLLAPDGRLYLVLKVGGPCAPFAAGRGFYAPPRTVGPYPLDDADAFPPLPLSPFVPHAAALSLRALVYRKRRKGGDVADDDQLDRSHPDHLSGFRIVATFSIAIADVILNSRLRDAGALGQGRTARERSKLLFDRDRLVASATADDGGAAALGADIGVPVELRAPVCLFSVNLADAILRCVVAPIANDDDDA